MTLAEQLELIRGMWMHPPGDAYALPCRVVTIGPGDEEWAVLDARGDVAYVGPAIFAARVAAQLSR